MPDPDRLPAVAPGPARRGGRFGTPAVRHRRGGPGGRGRRAPGGVPRPVDAPVLGQGERRGRDRRPARRARASARTSSRAASGRSPGGPGSRTRGSRSRASARPTPTCGAAVRAAAAGDPLRWVAVESADEAAASSRRLARRARVRLDVLLRFNPSVEPETLRGLAVGAGSSKFGLADDELAAADRGRWRRRRPAALARPPPPRRLAARRGRRLARRGPPRPGARWPCCGGGLPELRHARRRRRLPRPALGDAAPRPERFARELPALLDAPSRPTGDPSGSAIEPGRFLVARAGWLVGSRAPRPRAGRPDGRPRRRDDRADPAGAVRSRSPDRRADLARAAGRSAAAGRRRRGGRVERAASTESTGRSASRPTSSARTSCRRSGGATSSRSVTRAPTARRSARPTTAGRGRRRSSSRRTARLTLARRRGSLAALG